MKKAAISLAAVLLVLIVVIVAIAVKSGKDKNTDVSKKVNEAKNEITETITDISSDILGTETTSADTSVTDVSGETVSSGTVTDNSSSTTKSNGFFTLPTTAAPATSAGGSPTSKNSATTKASGTTTTTAAAQSTYEYAYAGYNPQTADMNGKNGDWRLILVNRDYILPDGYKPELAHSVEGDDDSKMLDKRVAPFYNKMYQAALKDGITLTTVSGYRSYELQKNNFENKITYYRNQGYDRTTATQMAAKVILPPGTSEHNAGLAMDIISLEQSFENTKAFQWLSKNAADYGFILRYPEDKQDVTKIIYEPWHWRYVGVEAAKEIKSKGITLEEYLGMA